jgi:hypothetical protein
MESNMKGKLSSIAPSVHMRVRDNTIERVAETTFFKLGVISMGKPIPEEFVVLMSGTNGKVHIELMVQNLNQKTHKIYQMAMLVPDDQQWELLVDYAQRSKLITKERMTWVWREARRLNMPLDVQGIKDIAFDRGVAQK